MVLHQPRALPWAIESVPVGAKSGEHLAMNTKLLHRLAWKELRSLRALWLSLLGMAIVFELGLAWLANQPHERSEWVFSVALFLPVVYSLACAAMAFAGEREEGTDQFLSRLAVPPLALLGVKLGMNLLSTAALLIILYPLAWVLAPWQTYWDLSRWQGPLASRQMMALAWGMGLLSWGLLCSLLFRRVLTCLIVATVATALTPVVVSVFMDLLPSQQTHSDAVEWTLRLGVIPYVLLMASVWLVQRWDEDRWPRMVERLGGIGRRLSGLRLRVVSSDGAVDVAPTSLLPDVLRIEVGSRAGIASVVQAMLRRIGFCWPDEWLPAWRREVRRLLWLEWQSAWWVFLGLIVAGSLGLWAFVGTASSKTDMRLMLSTLPPTLAFVAFALGVWSFHGQQREQRFRFFAGHGASPTTMWLVKHVVWLSLAVLAVAFLLSLTALVTDGAINRDEFSASGWQNVIQATFHDEHFLANEIMERPDWRFRLVYCVAHTTFTRPTEFYDTNAVASVWPLVSLVWLAMGRGVLLVWLCFAVGQLVSLLIPRAVTSMLVGMLALGMAGWWWLVISILRVPLLIGVWPVLIGLLAASWERMSDWLEERSDWRRWLRVAVTALVPMLVAFVGMAAYRAYEVPFVELPWQPEGPASFEARRTGEDWLRLAERLESPFDRRDASRINYDSRLVRALERSPDRKNPVDKNFTQIRKADLNALKDAHWHGFAERYWLMDNAAALEEALQLANRLDCVMPKSWDPSNDLKREQCGCVVLLLKMSAFESLANHRLDEALQRALALYRFGQHLERGEGRDRYRAVDVQQAALHVLREWALSPDQSEASLLAALGRSDQGQPHPVAQLVRAEGSFAVDPFELLRSEYSDSLAMHNLRWRERQSPYRWASWEKSRQERLLNVLAIEGDANLRRGLTHRIWWDPSANPRQLNTPYNRLLQNTEADDRDGSERSPSPGGRWQQTTPVSLGSKWHEVVSANDFLHVLASLETHRRGLWLTLALQAHRQKHGRLPDRLDELVGPYLDRLPSDPINGQAFEYRSGGFPFVILSDNHRLPPSTPLLSAPGSQAARLEPLTEEYARRYGIHFNESPSANGLNWASVFANSRRYEQVINDVFRHYGTTFSLSPSL